MTFGQALKSTYAGATAFLLACPLLALVPTLFELLQHAVEVRIGFYDGIAAAKALEHHPMRMAFGMVNVIALLVPGYWVVRFLPRRDAAFARTPDGRAVRLFAVFVTVEAALAALQLFALPATAAALLTGFVVGSVIAALLVAWGVAAALGCAQIGPLRSAAIMWRYLPWTIALQLVAVLPLMIPHYILGALAIVGPKPLLWLVLVVDSLLISAMTAVMIASGYYAAMRAAVREGTVPAS